MSKTRLRQDPFATTKQATEAVGVHIMESQKLFGPLQAAVARTHPPGLLLPGLSNTTNRFQTVCLDLGLRLCYYGSYTDREPTARRKNYWVSTRTSANFRKS